MRISTLIGAAALAGLMASTAPVLAQPMDGAMPMRHGMHGRMMHRERMMHHRKMMMHHRSKMMHHRMMHRKMMNNM